MCIFHLYSDTESEENTFQNVSLIECMDNTITENDQECESSDYLSIWKTLMRNLNILPGHRERMKGMFELVGRLNPRS